VADAAPAPTPSLASLPTTRRALLVALKKRGEASAEDLAAQLAITVSAVRQHLAGLVGDGLVAHRAERGRPGRPRHRYHLTEAGESLFPRRYGDLANELLTYVEDEDPELVERVFERRRVRRVEQARERLAGLGFGEQVEELARILDEDGYLAHVERTADGAWRIVEYNCAILSVALRYGTACGTELSFLREVLPGATVERVAHMVAGSHHCAYEVRPRP
jgi:DeoR family suf operon transcriptional repressor